MKGESLAESQNGKEKQQIADIKNTWTNAINQRLARQKRKASVVTLRSLDRLRYENVLSFGPS
jgi:hypothetical protein